MGIVANLPAIFFTRELLDSYRIRLICQNLLLSFWTSHSKAAACTVCGCYLHANDASSMNSSSICPASCWLHVGTTPPCQFESSACIVDDGEDCLDSTWNLN